MKRIVILGSTGSIGRQVLDVVRSSSEDFKILALAAHKNVDLLKQQCEEFSPSRSILTAACENPIQEIHTLSQLAEADIIVNALSGSIGIHATLAAISAGKTIALANKESLVIAGALIMQELKKTGAQIIPIDSELSALSDLIHRDRGNIKKITLTASGGPFWGWSLQRLRRATPQQALKHPTWKMGKKISIDSATLMNKAFEMIAARWLFDLPLRSIEVCVHRQALVHAFVHRTDSSVLAALSVPDMRLPIARALGIENYSHIQEMQIQNLNFEPVSNTPLKGISYAHRVLEMGGTAGATLCIADEGAVNRFLESKIGFLEIYDEIDAALKKISSAPLSLNQL